eukprot:scaffold2971_cov274-Pinguiococcus_pyrenoidosus.AAC.9
MRYGSNGAAAIRSPLIADFSSVISLRGTCGSVGLRVCGSAGLRVCGSAGLRYLRVCGVAETVHANKTSYCH